MTSKLCKEQWSLLRALVPDDLEARARRSHALRRARGVKDGETLRGSCFSTSRAAIPLSRRPCVPRNWAWRTSVRWRCSSACARRAHGSKGFARNSSPSILRRVPWCGLSRGAPSGRWMLRMSASPARQAAVGGSTTASPCQGCGVNLHRSPRTPPFRRRTNAH